jgi:hypothetical protein
MATTNSAIDSAPNAVVIAATLPAVPPAQSSGTVTPSVAKLPSGKSPTQAAAKSPDVKVATGKAPVKKAAAKKTPVKKTATKKTSVKKPVVKKTVPMKTAPLAPIFKALVPSKAKQDGKQKKPKLVRDSFTIPKAEYAVLDELKLRSDKLGRFSKKSEMLRAGIKILAALSDSALLSALAQVPIIKTGRPTSKK